VHGSTDAARAAADIVLTEPGLSTLIDALLVSRSVFQRMRSFLVYRISATVQLLLFFTIAVYAFDPKKYEDVAQVLKNGDEPSEYPAFFKLPVLLLMLITLLNDGCLLTIGYDNVQPPKHPMTWNVSVIFVVAIVMSLVALFSSLLLLYFGLDSTNPSGVFQGIGLPLLQFEHIIMMMYLKISISDFLTLFSSRTNDHFFWHTRPHPLLMIAATISLIISSMLASFWPKGKLDHMPIEGLAYSDQKLLPLYVWLYSLFWWLIQDAVKVGVYRFLGHFKLLGYQSDNVKPEPRRAPSTHALPPVVPPHAAALRPRGRRRAAAARRL
jgi:H+-transporting ATPase